MKLKLIIPVIFILCNPFYGVHNKENRNGLNLRNDLQSSDSSRFEYLNDPASIEAMKRHIHSLAESSEVHRRRMRFRSKSSNNLISSDNAKSAKDSSLNESNGNVRNENNENVAETSINNNKDVQEEKPIIRTRSNEELKSWGSWKSEDDKKFMINGLLDETRERLQNNQRLAKDSRIKNRDRNEVQTNKNSNMKRMKPQNEARRPVIQNNKNSASKNRENQVRDSKPNKRINEVQPAIQNNNNKDSKTKENWKKVKNSSAMINGTRNKINDTPGNVKNNSQKITEGTKRLPNKDIPNGGLKTRNRQNEGQPAAGLSTNRSANQRQPIAGLSTNRSGNRKQLTAEGLRMNSRQNEGQPAAGLSANQRQPTAGLSINRSGNRKQSTAEGLRINNRQNEGQPTAGLNMNRNANRAQHGTDGLRTNNRPTQNQPTGGLNPNRSTYGKQSKTEGLRTNSRPKQRPPIAGLTINANTENRSNERQPAARLRTNNRSNEGQNSGGFSTNRRENRVQLPNQSRSNIRPNEPQLPNQSQRSRNFNEPQNRLNPQQHLNQSRPSRRLNQTQPTTTNRSGINRNSNENQTVRNRNNTGQRRSRPQQQSIDNDSSRSTINELLDETNEAIADARNDIQNLTEDSRRMRPRPNRTQPVSQRDEYKEFDGEEDYDEDYEEYDDDGYMINGRISRPQPIVPDSTTNQDDYNEFGGSARYMINGSLNGTQPIIIGPNQRFLANSQYGFNGYPNATYTYIPKSIESSVQAADEVIKQVEELDEYNKQLENRKKNYIILKKLIKDPVEINEHKKFNGIEVSIDSDIEVWDEKSVNYLKRRIEISEPQFRDDRFQRNNIIDISEPKVGRNDYYKDIVEISEPKISDNSLYNFQNENKKVGNRKNAGKYLNLGKNNLVEISEPLVNGNPFKRDTVEISEPKINDNRLYNFQNENKKIGNVIQIPIENQSQDDKNAGQNFLNLSKSNLVSISDPVVSRNPFKTNTFEISEPEIIEFNARKIVEGGGQYNRFNLRKNQNKSPNNQQIRENFSKHNPGEISNSKIENNLPNVPIDSIIPKDDKKYMNLLKNDVVEISSRLPYIYDHHINEWPEIQNYISDMRDKNFLNNQYEKLENKTESINDQQQGYYDDEIKFDTPKNITGSTRTFLDLLYDSFHTGKDSNPKKHISSNYYDNYNSSNYYYYPTENQKISYSYDQSPRKNNRSDRRKRSKKYYYPFVETNPTQKISSPTTDTVYVIPNQKDLNLVDFISLISNQNNHMNFKSIIDTLFDNFGHDNNESELPYKISPNNPHLSSLDHGSGITTRIVDYAVTEIIDKDKKLISQTEFVYISMDTISLYIEDEKQLPKGSEINEMILGGKKIIMPIAYEGNHAVVLLADTDTKEAQYYEPNDPTLSYFDRAGIIRLRNFLIMIKRRNGIVGNYDWIDYNGWRLIRPKVELRRQMDDFNCGVHAIQFIDYSLNGRLSFPAPINEYRAHLKNAIINKILEKNGNKKHQSHHIPSSPKKHKYPFHNRHSVLSVPVMV